MKSFQGASRSPKHYFGKTQPSFKIDIFTVLSPPFLFPSQMIQLVCSLQINIYKNTKLSFSLRLGLNLYRMRFGFTSLDENIFPPDGCTGSICLLSVRLCPSLHHSVKGKENEGSFSALWRFKLTDNLLALISSWWSPWWRWHFALQPMRRMIYEHLFSYFVVTTPTLTFVLWPRADS